MDPLGQFDVLQYWDRSSNLLFHPVIEYYQQVNQSQDWFQNTRRLAKTKIFNDTFKWLVWLNQEANPGPRALWANTLPLDNGGDQHNVEMWYDETQYGGVM